VIERGRRDGLRLKTEMQFTGFSCGDDDPVWEG
jgi:hypothetical protein